MPTLSAYVDEDFAKAVDNAVKAAGAKNPSQYVKEAIEQRMEREGMIPENVVAELIAAANEFGVPDALTVLRKELRRKGNAVRGAKGKK